MIASCLRLTFDLLLPDLAAKLQKKQLKRKEGHENSAKLQSFSLEDSVYVRNYSYGPKWVPAEIERCTVHRSLLEQAIPGKDMFIRFAEEIHSEFQSLNA